MKLLVAAPSLQILWPKHVYVFITRVCLSHTDRIPKTEL